MVTAYLYYDKSIIFYLRSILYILDPFTAVNLLVGKTGNFHKSVW